MRDAPAIADPLADLKPPTRTPAHAERADERRVIALEPYVLAREDGGHRLHLMVENVSCGACVARIERGLRQLDGVDHARVNLSTRRLMLDWHGPIAAATAYLDRLSELGYPAVPYDPERIASLDAREDRALLRAMAVAGFASANVMLLSVSIWAGHSQGMGPATRDFLHWLSALIVLPALVYSGRPFFRSAIGALRHGRTNMDVPITIGIVLAAGMSLFETMRGGPHAYFDSAIMLVFFLLIGRWLEKRARGRARQAAERLLALGARAVTVLDADGRTQVMAPEQVHSGMTVLTATGERIAVDGVVTSGRSELDTSLITGESAPRAVKPGDAVFAGTLNLSAPLQITTKAVGEGTLLAEIVRLMEVAEQRKARFVGLADRIARLYAPVVHSLAALTCIGWLAFTEIAWQQALLYAVSVLIITCPCALGLAVPAVQVIASGRLLRAGTLLKSGSALERLAAIDTIVFDKTGTLTEGRLRLCTDATIDPDALRQASSLAASSRHPLARALRAAAPDAPAARGVEERPGQGLVCGELKLGSRSFVGVVDSGPDSDRPELWLARPGVAPVRFSFDDQLRSDAAETVGALRAQGYGLMMLSGDRPGVAAAIAGELGITDYQAGCTPADKVKRLEALAETGKTVLMVGDGLNDAPALAAAHVSLSPSSAADISQTAADAVFQGDKLAPVALTLEVARRAEALVKQNIALALIYNVLAVPVAVLGHVTPLIAALAMSASSIVVIVNAMRLAREPQR